MMSNLFSIFDPHTNFFISNWLSLLLFIFLVPFKKWFNWGRYEELYNLLCKYILNEFKPLLQKSKSLLIFIFSIFMFIMFNNVMGLFSYIFTASSHMSFSLSLALPVWMGLIFYCLIFNMSNTLIHLIPQGTPYILMPFMVLIESVSNIIRPITLAVRLAANMIAGHLLLVLISSAMFQLPILSFLIFPCLTMLIILEVAVALIQAYVMSILITLYSSEAMN